MHPLAHLSKYEIILGSQSPRRKELLEQFDLNFRVETRNVAECYPPTLEQSKIPEYLARLKSTPFEPTLTSAQLLITADTLVFFGGKVLGKPADKEEAREMLTQLSNQTHQVISGVCLTQKDRQESFSSTSHVTLRELSPEEIEYYIEHCQPLDKAGAYGIQEWIGAVGIRRIEGEYSNVVGLPTCQLYELLKKWN